MKQSAQQASARNGLVRIGRRAYARYPLICRTAVLHCGSASEPCIVKNISAGGLMARIYKDVALEGDVAIDFEGDIRLIGRIAWSHGWDLGIAFDRPVDVDGVLSSLAACDTGENRRALPRTPVSCPAQLRLPSRILKARLKDISPAGASVETLRKMEAGARVTLTLPDLPPITGTVRWSNETSAGLLFDQPLPAEALNEWLSARRR